MTIHALSFNLILILSVFYCLVILAAISLNIVNLKFFYLNFAISLLFVRPNILGEAVGFLQPLFWILTHVMLQPRPHKTPKFHKQLQIITICSVLYWIYIYFINQYFGMSSNFWSIISSIIAFVVPGYVITSSYENQRIKILEKAYVFTISAFCLAYVIQMILHLPCTTVSFANLGSRTYGYSVCLPGSIMLGNRLTGIGGEPGIFAVEIVIAIILGARLASGIFIRLIGNLLFLFCLIATNASTGYACLSIVVLFYIVKKSRRNPFLSFFLLIVFFPLIDFISKKLLFYKMKDAPLSISDRGLDVSFYEYLQNWINFPFGNRTKIGTSNAINLLTNSFYYGIFVFAIFVCLLILLLINGPKNFKFQSSLLVVAFTVVFSQPPFLNTLWFILILLCGEETKSKDVMQ